MVDKIGPIKNPLTIIAMFAAIAEISGTVVLPFIEAANQATYVWFLIVFPILLIVLFFLTLNFNHKVLYAPSDYKNEDNFFQSLPRATYTEKFLKIKEELAESEVVTAASTKPEPRPTESTITPDKFKAELMADVSLFPSNSNNKSFVQRSGDEATYILAEDLIFRKLSSAFSSQIQREVKLGPWTLDGRNIFDGIVRDKGVTTVIEVKFCRNEMMTLIQIRKYFAHVLESARFLPSDQTTNLRVLLAIVLYKGIASQERVAAEIDRNRSEFPFPIEVRFYNMADLEREFKQGALTQNKF